MKFFLVFLDPNFKEPIANVTAPVGREAILSCVVQDLAEYKVSFYYVCIAIRSERVSIMIEIIPYRKKFLYLQKIF